MALRWNGCATGALLQRLFRWSAKGHYIASARVDPMAPKRETWAPHTLPKFAENVILSVQSSIFVLAEPILS